jgi:hypothetical protein
MARASAKGKAQVGPAQGPALQSPGTTGKGDVSTPASSAAGLDRRRAASACGWCGTALEPKARGRIPKWCSASCRQRAWEQARAAASGRSAVQVVERRVEIPVPMPPTRRDWPRLLDELAHQVDDGRVYDRDLDGLTSALTAALDAVGRRPYVRSRTTGLR